MKSTLLLLGMLVLANAQVPPELPKNPEPPKPVQKVLDVKYLNGDRAHRAVKLVNEFMHPGGYMRFDPVLRTAIMVGPEQIVTGAEALFRKFDAPGGVQLDSQIQFRVFLVEGSPDPAAPGALPTEIAAAVDQMRKSFVYKGFRLLDTILLQARGSGEAGTTGMLPAQGDRPDIRTTYNLGFKQADVLEDAKTVIVRGLRFHLKLPIMAPNGNFNYAESNLNTDLTVQEGQKLVVGKLSSEQTRNAIFLIITVDVQ